MFLLLGHPNIIAEDQYNLLKNELQSLIQNIEAMQLKLAEVNKILTVQMFFHEPTIILSIMNAKNGAKWLGRIKVPDELLPYFSNTKGNRFYISFIVCDATEHSDKSDPQLLQKAMEVGKRTLKKRFNY